MVKTTVILEDDVYKRLAKEAVEKYGKMRSISRLINEKLKNAGFVGEKKEITGKNISDKTAGLWRIKGTGAGYVRKLRKESERRFKRIGI